MRRRMVRGALGGGAATLILGGIWLFTDPDEAGAPSLEELMKRAAKSTIKAAFIGACAGMMAGRS